MTEAYKWGKEYREGSEAAQRGDNPTKNPYYSADYSTDNSDEDMIRGYHWRRGWWDAMQDMMKEEAA